MGVRAKSTNTSENREIEQCQDGTPMSITAKCYTARLTKCVNVAARRSMRHRKFFIWSATDAIATWRPRKQEQKSEV
jgi:hypothetical protein